MNYYFHIYITLMHIYIRCITFDLLVIVEYITAICGIHVRDTKLLKHSFTLVVIYKVTLRGSSHKVSFYTFPRETKFNKS
jgi:hypothetical protein